MGIEQIDKNFKPSGVSSNDLVWQNCKNKPFDVRGVFYSEKDKAYIKSMIYHLERHLALRPNSQDGLQPTSILPRLSLQSLKILLFRLDVLEY